MGARRYGPDIIGAVLIAFGASWLWGGRADATTTFTTCPRPVWLPSPGGVSGIGIRSSNTRFLVSSGIADPPADGSFTAGAEGIWNVISTGGTNAFRLQNPAESNANWQYLGTGPSAGMEGLAAYSAAAIATQGSWVVTGPFSGSYYQLTDSATGHSLYSSGDNNIWAVSIAGSTDPGFLWRFVNMTCLSPCSQQGVLSPTVAACICDPQWTGPNCSACSGGWGLTRCQTCGSLWSGTNCNIQCSGYGTAVAGACSCIPNWIGPLCATPDCSGNGLRPVGGGACMCVPPWGGALCNQTQASMCTSADMSWDMLGESAYNSRSNDARVFQYSFTQANQNLPLAADGGCSPIGRLINESAGALWNSNRAGLSFPTGTGNRLVSEYDIGSLVQSLQRNFTVEMWISSSTTMPSATNYVMLFADLGSTDEASTFQSTIGSPSNDVSAYLVQYQGILNAGFDAPYGASIAGNLVGPPTGTFAYPIHVVVTYSFPSFYAGQFGSVTAMYVDTIPVEETILMATPELPVQWHTDNRVHIARSSADGDGDSSAWDGTVYSFAVYNRSLSLDEIGTLYDAYLPNSLPYIVDSAGTQHASVEDRYWTPITLNGYDFDLAMNATWSASTKPSGLSPLPLVFRIVSYPAAGLLAIIEDGTPMEINATALPYTLPSPVGEEGVVVYYTNSAYGYGTNYDTFMYDLSDQISPLRPSSIVIVDVAFADHPPTALDQVVTAASQVPLTIQLHGSDPDYSNSAFQGTAIITYFPTAGVLLQGDGTPITDIPPILTSPDYLVIYTPNALPDDDNTELVQAVDFFQFNLVDTDHAQSTFPGTVTIDIAHNLQPLQGDISTCAEDDRYGDCVISLDASNPLHFVNYSFLLTSLPVYGSLWYTTPDADDDTGPLRTVPLELPVNATLFYATYNYYWNGNDSFTFRVQRGSYISPNGTKSIHIAPVNDPPVLSGSFLAIIPFLGSANISLRFSDPDLIWGVPPVNPVYTMHVSANDNDLAVQVSLNPSVLGLVTLSYGSGTNMYGSPEVSYSGTPAVVNRSLTPGLVRSVNSGTHVITFELFDEGGASSTWNLTVKVVGDSSSLQSTNASGLTNTELWIVWIAGILVLLCICYGCEQHCCAKKRPATTKEELAEFTKWKASAAKPPVTGEMSRLL